MSRRNDRGQYAKPASRRAVAISWLVALLSVVLVAWSGAMVMGSFGAFRSCTANNAGVTVASCGKQSLNAGDFILIGLFILAFCLTLSLFTHAWRLTRRVR